MHRPWSSLVHENARDHLHLVSRVPAPVAFSQDFPGARLHTLEGGATGADASILTVKTSGYPNPSSSLPALHLSPLKRFGVTRPI